MKHPYGGVVLSTSFSAGGADAYFTHTLACREPAEAASSRFVDSPHCSCRKPGMEGGY